MEPKSFSDVSNSDVEKIILETYKNEKNRNILRDRIFKGMTYDALLDKYYPECEWMGRRDYNKKREAIIKMVDKVKKAIRNRYESLCDF